eukprot:m51a1_g659 hypothetical protein (345) ;mRNA; f:228908-230300
MSSDEASDVECAGITSYAPHPAAASTAPRRRLVLVHCPPAPGTVAEPRRPDADALELVELPHPRTGARVQYALGAGTGALLELQRGKLAHASWFVGDAVVPDGSLTVASPVDPLFVALGRVDARAASAERFYDVEELVCGGEQDAKPLLRAAGLRSRLHLICDVQKVDGDEYYKLSEAKCVAWLRAKVERLKGAVRSEAPELARSGCSVAGFSGAAHQELSDEGVLRASLGLLSEYVSDSWLRKVAADCGLANYAPPRAAADVAALPAGVVPAAVKRYREDANAGSPMPQHKGKRQKTAEPQPKTRAAMQKSREAAKTRRNEEAAKGSKSLTSFFFAPPPKTPT